MFVFVLWIWSHSITLLLSQALKLLVINSKVTAPAHLIYCTEQYFDFCVQKGKHLYLKKTNRKPQNMSGVTLKILPEVF